MKGDGGERGGSSERRRKRNENQCSGHGVRKAMSEGNGEAAKNRGESSSGGEQPCKEGTTRAQSRRGEEGKRDRAKLRKRE